MKSIFECCALTMAIAGRETTVACHCGRTWARKLHDEDRRAFAWYQVQDETGRTISHADATPSEPSMWEMLDKLAGNPDYAVCVMAWPWPDGGWMAGISLIDRGWAERQRMSPAILRLEESVGYHGLEWNCFDGFARGINAHSSDGPGAVKELLHKIKEIEKLDSIPSFEPPKVTPVGNMNDLLQAVCHHDHDDE